MRNKEHSEILDMVVRVRVVASDNNGIGVPSKIAKQALKDLNLEVCGAGFFGVEGRHTEVDGYSYKTLKSGRRILRHGMRFP